MISEEQINRWANPPSDTESEKCTNAISQITDTLRDHFGNKISFVRQGSHYNRTNIKLDSDVDIAVVHSDTYFSGTSGMSEADKRLHDSKRIPPSYSYEQFKKEVSEVLQEKFGIIDVQRKNKCIRVVGNTHRVNADIVPAFKYRRYRSFGIVEAEGIGFIPDNEFVVTNSFPEQHYKEGVNKNDSTGRAYKSVVRIFKNVRNDLKDKGLLRHGDMPSFFIECLVWNVHESYFTGKTYWDDALAVADKIYEDMKNEDIANKYAEVCDLRWLFKGSLKHTHERAKDFALQIWSHIKKS